MEKTEKVDNMKDGIIMLEQLQVDCEEYILYAPKSLNYIVKPMINNLEIKIKEYYKIFKVNNFRRIQINLFDNIDNFRNYIYSLRDEGEILPEYAVGTFDQGMINSYLEKNLIIDSPKYNNAVHMASHELFHIMYQELVLNNDYNNRIIWFDEGMAYNFSGEMDTFNEKEEFKEYLKDVIINTKEIPNLTALNHGTEFVNNNYNGYDLSYIAVRYLLETMTKNDFYELVSDFDRIRLLGEGIVEASFNYYKKKLELTI